MSRELLEAQQRMINRFRQREEKSKGNESRYGAAGGPYCSACKCKIEVNEDARPSQAPEHCDECMVLIEEGLMALATGRLYATNTQGHCCFKEGDGCGNITGTDIITVISLLSDNPAAVTVCASREGAMTRIMAYCKA